MLYLQHAADGSAGDARPRVPLEDATAAYLERALLAGDEATRIREIEAAFAADEQLAGWALRTAECQSGRTINRIPEAAEWLCSRLASNLAGALIEVPPTSSADSVSWRLSKLVAKLNACERQCIDFESRLEREKLDAMKELAYGASHEINNPLANIAARAQTLLEDEHDPQRRQKLMAMHRQAMRAHEMISDLMLFARPPKLNRVPLDLDGLVRRVVLGLSELAQENNIRLEWFGDEKPVEVVGDETHLGVAIQAVVKNAIEAVSEGGRVTMAVRLASNGAKPQAEVVVRDDGPGISDEVRRHIFDPFFSGREAGRGLGFGLSKCWRIVTDHGGQVVVNNLADAGAEISIQLPISCAVTQEPQVHR
jgi:signal transduction histidine kinase